MGKNLSKAGYNVRSGVWIGYVDRNGPGAAEIDHLVYWKGGLVIIECKLSQTPNAELQISELYHPLLKHIFRGQLVQGVQVCKYLYMAPNNPVGSLREVLAARTEDIFTWHHLGRV